MAPLRLDARLFEPPTRRDGKPRGRPPLVGARVPNLEQVAVAPTTRCTAVWCRGMVARTWSSTGRPAGSVVHDGHAAAAHSLALGADPHGERPTRAFFSTDTAHGAANMIAPSYIAGRWKWPFRKPGRISAWRPSASGAIWPSSATAALLGLFSLVVLLAHAFYPSGDLPLPQVAWYPKTHATFHDVLALVRRRLWQPFLLQTDAAAADLRFSDPAQIEHLLSAACY